MGWLVRSYRDMSHTHTHIPSLSTGIWDSWWLGGVIGNGSENIPVWNTNMNNMKEYMTYKTVTCMLHDMYMHPHILSLSLFPVIFNGRTRVNKDHVRSDWTVSAGYSLRSRPFIVQW